MKIQFIGGARTVTGSQHLLFVNEKKILLECGLFQGKRKNTYEKNKNFSYNPAEIDAMILSHAHIDHSGNIPNLTSMVLKENIRNRCHSRVMPNYVKRFCLFTGAGR